MYIKVHALLLLNVIYLYFVYVYVNVGILTTHYSIHVEAKGQFCGVWAQAEVDRLVCLWPLSHLTSPSWLTWATIFAKHKLGWENKKVGGGGAAIT